MSFPHRVSFHSVPSRSSCRPAAQSGGTLIRAYPARAPAPGGACFAPARFVRLIARMRSRASRTHLACWPNRGLFRAGANGGTKRPRERRSFPPAAYCNTIFQNASHFRIISENQNTTCFQAAPGRGASLEQPDRWVTVFCVRSPSARPGRAVDRLYRQTLFASEYECVKHLVALYEKMRVPLAAGMREKGRQRFQIGVIMH